MDITEIKDPAHFSSIYKDIEQRRCSPFHDVHYLTDSISWSNVKLFFIQDKEIALTTLFEIRPDAQYATCLMPISPFMGHVSEFVKNPSLIEEIFFTLTQRIGKPLYFPLVYKGDISTCLMTSQDFVTWQRLPSPIILGRSLEHGLTERLYERIGNRAARRIKKFCSANFSVYTAHKNEVMDAIEHIEIQSWKAKLKQDMISRNQLPTFKALSKSESSFVRIVSDSSCGLPVAYRFDYKIDKVVHALKWSFDEKYRRYSPGFYLLSEDLRKCWNTSDIDHLDLHGSQDTLKISVCDHGMEKDRVDYAYPRSEIVERLQAERLAHDAKVFIAAANNKAIRTLYE